MMVLNCRIEAQIKQGNAIENRQEPKQNCFILEQVLFDLKMMGFVLTVSSVAPNGVTSVGRIFPNLTFR